MRRTWLDVQAVLMASPVLACDSETYPTTPTLQTPRPVAWACCAATSEGVPLATILAGAGAAVLVNWGGGGNWETYTLPYCPLYGASQQPPSAAAWLARASLAAASAHRPLAGHRVLYDLGCATAWGWLDAGLVGQAIAAGAIVCTRFGAALAGGMGHPHLACLATHGLWAAAAGYTAEAQRMRSRVLALGTVAAQYGAPPEDKWAGGAKPQGWGLQWGTLANTPAPSWPLPARAYLVGDVHRTALVAAQQPPAMPGLGVWGMYLWEAFGGHLGAPTRARNFAVAVGDQLVDMAGGSVVEVTGASGGQLVCTEEVRLCPPATLVAEGLVGLRACGAN